MHPGAKPPSTPVSPCSDTLALIVPFHEDSAAARVCLKGIELLNPCPEELVLVWDGAGSPPPDLAPRAVWVVSGRGGPAIARNVGAAASCSVWLAFVDSDVLVRSDFVARVRERIEGLGEARAFFGSYDTAPAAPGLYSRYRNLFHHFVHQHSPGEASTFWSGCGVVQRAAFDSVSGFSTPFIEDIDLGIRLRGAGHRIRCEPSLQVTHLKRWRLRDIWFTDVLLRAWPWAIVSLETRELPNALNVTWRARISGALVVLSSILSLAGGNSSALGASTLLLLVTLVNADLHAFMARQGGIPLLFTSLLAHTIYLLLSSATYLAAVVRVAFLTAFSGVEREARDETPGADERHAEATLPPGPP